MNELIDQASQEYAKQNSWYPGETSYESDIMAMEESFSDAFKAGAYFFKKSVWHKSCEIPKPRKYCLVEYMNGDGNVCYRIDSRSEYEWVQASHYDRVLRWVYIEDLLP